MSLPQPQPRALKGHPDLGKGVGGRRVGHSIHGLLKQELPPPRSPSHSAKTLIFVAKQCGPKFPSESSGEHRWGETGSGRAPNSAADGWRHLGPERVRDLVRVAQLLRIPCARELVRTANPPGCHCFKAAAFPREAVGLYDRHPGVFLREAPISPDSGAECRVIRGSASDI